MRVLISTCRTCHLPHRERCVFSLGLWRAGWLVILGLQGLSTLKLGYLLGGAYLYQIASLVVESLLLEAKLGESPAYLLGTELLGDAIADDLEGSGCRHEYTALILGGFAEVYIYQFSLQSGCLKLAVVLVELLYLSLGKPVLIAALVEQVSLGVDALVVEGMLSGR